jgi:hypothetical protein
MAKSQSGICEGPRSLRRQRRVCNAALLHVNKLSNAARAAVESEAADEAALAERNFGSSANQSQKFARSLSETFSAPLSAHSWLFGRKNLQCLHTRRSFPQTPHLNERPIGSASTTGDPQYQHMLPPI